ncbi:hypothetical protein EYZ11_013364 [Aspergillus tanneri]|uniref:Uncharacterized protein n=1 Tax=Aspergillus tanneri TaxID=1220188 RepID=A0A4S3IXU1_9EURO|nr:hypothetical protein EYZ11_013364 [Aspergillus tanneri]
MPEQYIEVENRIIKACEALRRSKKPNIAATALNLSPTASTITQCANAVIARNTKPN